MERMLVSGAGGFVGSRVMLKLKDKFELLAFPKGMLSKADESQVMDVINRMQPDIILNNAAISDTGYSETHPEESYIANVSLPVWMARGARRVGAKLISFSSDQVYTGLADKGPFDESILLSPTNVYGRHKLEAEMRTLDILPDAIMLRATWMYDFPCCDIPTHTNLLIRIMQAAVCGEPLSFSQYDYRGITYVRHAIDMLPSVTRLPGGVYNFGSENALSMYQTVLYFVDALGLKLNIQCTDFKRSLAIDCGKLRRNGISLDDTKSGLHRCLADYGLIHN